MKTYFALVGITLIVFATVLAYRRFATLMNGVTTTSYVRGWDRRQGRFRLLFKRSAAASGEKFVRTHLWLLVEMAGTFLVGQTG